MTNKAVSQSRNWEEEGLNRLASLYREIGISAVAAALGVTVSKAAAEASPDPLPAAAETSGKVAA